MAEELVKNGTFSNWTDDDPDDWSVSGESGNDPEISEVGPGESHEGIGTGLCNLYTSDGTYIYMLQEISYVPGKTYRLRITIDTVAAGILKVEDYPRGQWNTKDINSPGTHSWTFLATATSSNLLLGRSSPTDPSDVTFDNVSIKLEEGPEEGWARFRGRAGFRDRYK